MILVSPNVGLDTSNISNEQMDKFESMAKADPSQESIKFKTSSAEYMREYYDDKLQYRGKY